MFAFAERAPAVQSFVESVLTPAKRVPTFWSFGVSVFTSLRRVLAL